ncbi:MAG: sensor histidine kinase [Flavobacteriales bacterium]|nr:MAG: sensor histidine kinase [Flavobacteriales bacterium]
MKALSWRIWPIIAGALALLFITVGLLVVGEAHTVQENIGRQVDLLEEVSELTEAANQLGLTHRVDLHTMNNGGGEAETRWSRELDRFSQRLRKLGERYAQEPGVAELVVATPKLINDLDSLHHEVLARRTQPEEAAMPEAVFQIMVQRTAKQVDKVERFVHEDGLTVNAAILNDKWDQAQALLFAACFMAVVFAIMVGMSRRLLVESRAAEQGLLETKQQLEATNSELRETMLSKEEKEVMIKEIHHRVKNNLQIVKSLIRFQQDQVQDERTRELFNECITRVSAMALVHEQTYLTKDLANIPVDSYLDHLVRDLVHAYTVNIKLHMDIDIQVKTLSVDALVPLGLLINEVISNSFKYAFQGRSNGTITVHLHGSEQDGLHMRIGDDGVGLKSRDGFHRPNSLGMDLIHTLAGQLDGDMHLLEGPGTQYELVSRKQAKRKVA